MTDDREPEEDTTTVEEEDPEGDQPGSFPEDVSDDPVLPEDI